MAFLNPTQLLRLTELKAAVRARPGELSAWQELGDLCRHGGMVHEAIGHYQALVGAYAAQGAVYRAIGLCREILTLDPDHVETRRVLGELYARDTEGAGTPVTLPIAMSSALLPRSSRVPSVGVPGVGVAVADASDNIEDDNDDDALDDIDIDILDVDAIAGLTRTDGLVTLARPEQVPLFSGLSAQVFSILVAQLKAWEAAPGATIIAEGEVSESVFVVARGAVRVQREVNGATVVVAELGPHTFFGEIALLVHRPRAASVVAIEATQLLEIPKRIIDELIVLDPHVQDVIRHFAEDRLRHTTLLTSPLLSDLPEATKNDIGDLFAVRAVEPGDVLVTAGARAPLLGVVLSGVIDVVTNEGERLSALGVGDVFGEMSLVSHGVAEVSVVARTTGRVLGLAADDVDEVLFAQPALRARLAEVAEDRAAMNARFLHETRRV
jgi:cAMP-dependent protein kinase regulator